MSLGTNANTRLFRLSLVPALKLVPIHARSRAFSATGGIRPVLEGGRPDRGEPFLLPRRAAGSAGGPARDRGLTVAENPT